MGVGKEGENSSYVRTGNKVKADEAFPSYNNATQPQQNSGMFSLNKDHIGRTGNPDLDGSFMVTHKEQPTKHKFTPKIGKKTHDDLSAFHWVQKLSAIPEEESRARSWSMGNAPTY